MATCTVAGLEDLLGRLGLHDPIPASLSADVLTRPCDIYRAHLADITAKILDSDIAIPLEAISSSNTKDNGDLSLVLPKLGLDTARADEFIHGSLLKFKSALFPLPVADAVHLRFFFSLRTLPQLILSYIHDRADDYGRDLKLGLGGSSTSRNGARKRVVIDFSSPNLASEFTPSHLRSTIIGAQLANLYECMGWETVRLNYLGDWGKDLGLLAVGWDRFGSQEAFERDPMGHLLEVYDKINELFKGEKETRTKVREEGGDTAAVESQGIYAERDAFFKRMEDGEAEAIDLWKRIHAASIDYYRETYARLGIKFDTFSGESQVKPSTVEDVENTLKDKGIYECSDNSWIIDYSKHGPKSLGVSVLRGRTGTSSYLLRDVAAAIDRHNEFSFDKMVYVVASEQDVHFQKVFQALRYMGNEELADKLEHVGFGKVSGMSPQLGKVHLLGDILNQSINATRDVIGIDQEHHGHIENTEESATLLGISALIAQDASNRRTTSYKFNTKKMISLEGGTGPHLQSVYAKLGAKIEEANLGEMSLENIDYSHLQEEPWTDVLRLMAQYPDITVAAFKHHEPSLILGYLNRLMDEIVNDCLCEDDEEGSEPEDPEPPEAILAQAFLYKYARQVLKNGMLLLGFPLLSK
ncbi:arginyl-tRNA synthetase [Xylariaceae sp. AK1471]|nr:arginyl-tRNA synthetase [Xylariaceae sp. AK1471]